MIIKWIELQSSKEKTEAEKCQYAVTVPVTVSVKDAQTSMIEWSSTHWLFLQKLHSQCLKEFWVHVCKVNMNKCAGTLFISTEETFLVEWREKHISKGHGRSLVSVIMALKLLVLLSNETCLKLAHF